MVAPKPYKTNDLSTAEWNAVDKTLDTFIMLNRDDRATLRSLKRARRQLKKGALSEEGLCVTIACLMTMIDALSECELDDDIPLSHERQKIQLREDRESAFIKLQAMRQGANS